MKKKIKVKRFIIFVFFLHKVSYYFLLSMNLNTPKVITLLASNCLLNQSISKLRFMAKFRMRMPKFFASNLFLTKIFILWFSGSIPKFRYFQF